jgi:hypothetical protein
MADAIISFENNPYNAEQRLRQDYQVSGDDKAMMDAVVAGMSTKEAAEAWINSTMQADHWKKVARRDDDGYEWTEDVQVPYTDDVERAVSLYQQWLEEDLAEAQA